MLADFVAMDRRLEHSKFYCRRGNTRLLLEYSQRIYDCTTNICF